MDKQTIISKDIKFRGHLKFDHIVRIDGSFQGTIESLGNLIVGPTGDVEADIKTKNLEHYGKLIGNVISENKIILRKNAYLRGDLNCKDLEVESGSKFTGTCMMD